MRTLSYINRSIEYLFYSLFLLVPLVFAGNTSELFEFNKMWLTFGVTALILSLWLSKMVILRKVVFKRTIFDIPIFLFLISQIISTFLSLDPHISLWGYYSRWNGGLLSTITYIILFYAFVSNFFNTTPEKDYEKKDWIDKNPTADTIVKRSLFVSLIAGLIAVIWALPSHFGYDPTCLVFRGTFDVSCWTADFMPKVRIFGPLGQPNWLAGYLGILLPITAGFIIVSLRKSKKLLDPYLIGYSILFFLFYVALLYTRARSGIIAFVVSMSFMAIFYFWLNRKDLSFLKNIFVPIFLVALIVPIYVIQINMPFIDKFSLTYTKGLLTKPDPVSPPTAQKSTDDANSKPTAEETPPAISALTSGGTQSDQIRNIVWRGGLDAFKANPVFGTGVETFAFAYYKHRPIEHNNVSEWNFLYNKAHNEYVNYLATTGLFGFLTYMSFILLFIFLAFINLFNFKIKDIKYLGAIKAPFNYDKSDPLLLSFLTAFIAILIINFFGFSVVILNIYLFLIPAFALLILQLIKQNEFSDKVKYIDYTQWAGVSGLIFLAFAVIFILARFWIADTSYALGANYNKAGDYQTAYPLLQRAVDMRKEPVFRDELAVNKAVLALGLAQQQQQQTTESAQIIEKLATEALAENEKLVKEHPNNLLFLKSRVRILYTLANLDPNFMPAALLAIQAAANLAPTDASILYNLGVLYGQNGDSQSAIKVLEQTVAYKPNYREAHFALALFYHDLGVDANTGKIKDPVIRQKAIDQLNFLLTNLDPNYQQAKDSLSAWEKEK